MTEYLSRRTILAAGGAAAAAGALPFGACAQTAGGPIRTRKIPQASESIPVVGIGTSQLEATVAAMLLGGHDRVVLED